MSWYWQGIDRRETSSRAVCLQEGLTKRMNRLSAVRLLSFQRRLYTHCRSTTIDLRSDTATKPTKAVLEAMIQADVGDAAIGECPATAHLEQRTAALLGKECGLWVPTGTFANLLAVTLQIPQGTCLAGVSSHLIRLALHCRF